MDKLIAILICCGFFLLPDTASAYVGPGAGLSLLGALWALIVAVAAAVVFIFAWPIRRMRRRKREAKESEARERELQERGRENNETQNRDTEGREARERIGAAADPDTPTATPESVVQPDDVKRSRRQ